MERLVCLYLNYEWRNLVPTLETNPGLLMEKKKKDTEGNMSIRNLTDCIVKPEIPCSLLTSGPSGVCRVLTESSLFSAQVHVPYPVSYYISQTPPSPRPHSFRSLPAHTIIQTSKSHSPAGTIGLSASCYYEAFLPQI